MFSSLNFPDLWYSSSCCGGGGGGGNGSDRGSSSSSSSSSRSSSSSSHCSFIDTNGVRLTDESYKAIYDIQDH